LKLSEKKIFKVKSELFFVDSRVFEVVQLLEYASYAYH
jgi:hypothetical protein